MELARQQRDWQDLASLDQSWAILSNPDRRFGRWEDREFLEHGREEVAHLMKRAAKLGHPARHRSALDFGCGAGRLSRPMAEYFEEYVGVDISERMLETAERRTADIPGCRFLVNSTDRLPTFGDGCFDLIYSRRVLQHMPSRATIRSYLAEFARLLAPEGLVAFQLPSFISVRHRFQPRRRLYGALRRLRVPPTLLYRRLGLYPVRMMFLPVNDVTDFLRERGLRILDIETEDERGYVYSTYFATTR